MFWADKIAEDIKKRNLPLEWVDDMKTPSGRIHVGALRGVVVHDLVYKALLSLDVKATYTYVFEDHDPMDDVPVYLPESFHQYLGQPLFTIPSPVAGFENYAQYYAEEFKQVFNAIGCHPKILWTKDFYLSGQMNELIKTALDNADTIRDIYAQMYKKEIPKDWYPFQLLSPSTGKLSGSAVMDWDGEMVTYDFSRAKEPWCQGITDKGKMSPFSTKDTFVGKLPWKIEWPAKWKMIGVTVEGGGKDHMSAGGSHDLAKQICERVFHYPVPYPLPYEFFLVGGKKMSSSKGRGSGAAEMLEYLPSQLLRFLMVKTNIKQAINFDPSGDTIPTLFDEYQKAADAYFNNGDKDLARIFELSQIDEPKPVPQTRFTVLTQWVQMPNMQTKITEEDLEEWAKYARVWVERFAPEKDTFTVQQNIPEQAKELSKEQKAFLAKVAGELEKEWDAEDFQKELYEWTKAYEIASKEAFAAIYTALLGKHYGPKAAWLILSLEKDFVINRFKEIAGLEKEQERATTITKFNNPSIFSIDEKVVSKYPSISIGIAIIKGVSIQKENSDLEKEKQELSESLSSLTTEQVGQYPEIQSYRRLYKEMGIDWHSRRPSPEALLRRVALKKGLYTINTCVDAYNLVVMKHRVSVGAFDLDQIAFPTVLRFSREGEEILLLGDSEPTKYKETELAYFDQKGGYNIDFNFRDSQRTAVHQETKNLYINVDGIYDISPQKVEEVLKETCDVITKYCGGKVEEFGVVI